MLPFPPTPHKMKWAGLGGREPLFMWRTVTHRAIPFPVHLFDLFAVQNPFCDPPPPATFMQPFAGPARLVPPPRPLWAGKSLLPPSRGWGGGWAWSLEATAVVLCDRSPPNGGHVGPQEEGAQGAGIFFWDLFDSAHPMKWSRSV